MNEVIYPPYLWVLPGTVNIEADVDPTLHVGMLVYRWDDVTFAGQTTPPPSQDPEGEHPTFYRPGVPVRTEPVHYVGPPGYLDTWIATDYEVPLGSTAWYRVALLRVDGTYERWSPWVQVQGFAEDGSYVPVTVPKYDGWLLLDPLRTASLTAVTPELADVEITYPRNRAVFTPLRATRDVVMVGPVRGVELDVALIVRGAAAWSNLRDMLQASNPLLLRHPELGTIYTAPDSVQVTRIADVGSGEPLRRVTLRVHQVARP